MVGPFRVAFGGVLLISSTCGYCCCCQQPSSSHLSFTIAQAAETRASPKDAVSKSSSNDEAKVELVAACLGKLKCLPGSMIEVGPALRGLAAIGRGEAPVVGDEPDALSLTELEGLLHDAGVSLLELAEQVKGQIASKAVCAALHFLSFRCFCATEVLHQAVSGMGVDMVPEGDAVWGSILEVWENMSRPKMSFEGALADLTRWWLDRGEHSSHVATGGSQPTHEVGRDAAMTESLASIRQQAEWLRGEAAGELRSEAAAENLESAAAAIEELHQLLPCASLISGRKLNSAPEVACTGGVVCKATQSRSVFSSKCRILPEDAVEASDIEEWASEVDRGVKTLAACVSAVKRVQAASVAFGLPQVVQAPRCMALAHACIGGRSDEPTGDLSSIEVQVHTMRCWPLSALVRDEAWDDVGMEVKQQLALKLLWACAVAEVCGEALSGLSLNSFVMVGAVRGGMGDMIASVDVSQLEVVLSMCSSIWSSDGLHSSHSQSTGDGTAADLQELLREVLGLAGGPGAECTGAGLPFVSHSTSEHGLGGSLQVLEIEGSECCGRACLAGCQALGRRNQGRLSAVDESLSAWIERQVHESAAQAATVYTRGSPYSHETSTIAFRHACGNGDLKKVRELLTLTGAWAVDVHAADPDGPEAAFRLACSWGHTDIVCELLGLAGARAVDVHAADAGGPEAAFREACAKGHTEVVRELLALTGAREVDVHAHDSTGPEAAFRRAYLNGCVDIVRELLCLTGAREVDVHTADRSGPEAAFRYACRKGYTGIVCELLALTGEREVDVHVADNDGAEAAFRWACTHGHTDIVRELLGLTGARAVDVHAADPSGPEAGFRGACSNGHTDVVLELLALTGAREVDVHAADEKGPEAAFREACKYGHTDIVCELLGLTGAREVDVHAADERGPEAAFRWACGMGHTDIVCELLSLDGHRRIPDTERSRASSFPSLAELI